ncbi:MAG: glycosyltransferase family 39 protein [Anaerolineae bacterium]|nr:glycosyltransferase family 39 protein [Anaerolineae bacterium]
MMQTILAWILVGGVIAAGYPWSAWLLSKSKLPHSRWLTALFTLALSIGGLTLLMFWEALLEIPLSVWAITVPYFALMLPGEVLWWRGRNASVAESPKLATNRFPRWLAGGILVAISAAIFFNAVYWPFHREDTLGIYHRYGKLMYETGALAPFAGRDDAFYQAYPIQMPLAYTYAYLASGWVNEYLAKAIAALFSLACIPAVFELGRMLYGSLAGWLGALLLGFTQTFARWSSTGYVDLPMAFLYTLSAIFAWRLWEGGGWVDALLAGAALGLAAWTKNAALIATAFLVLWLLFGWLKGRIRLDHIALALAACALVAAPWYVRNWIEARLIMPPTAWTEQAERSLRTLFVFITQPENFALSGWIIVLATSGAMLEVLRQRVKAQTLFLLIWTIPFFGVWWLLVSYDPRFVLLFLPLLCVLGGRWLAGRWAKISPRWRPTVFRIAVLAALLWTLYIVWISVEYKPKILRDPLMGDEAKHALVLGIEPP